MVNDDSNGKIGCSAGRTKIVDPNDFNGFNSSSNMSVPLEDLNISVVLRTSKKGRTVLTSEGDKNTKNNKNQTSGSVAINFIEGTEMDGKKSLTTRYTDLTTVLDKNSQNHETLGITSIDINFNSSFAPMVVINFVDVRGSSIFQNEEQIADENSTNRYATLFQMPYPIFELEIKGYYGKPVTYCLHMWKFNSKFNSQTGNFEIQAEFIGYTYAMLSDLLIGYLKAIPFTKKGEQRYAAYNNNKTKQPIINLPTLVQKINGINQGLQKRTSDSQNTVTFNNATTGGEMITDIQNRINLLGSVLTNIKDTKTEDLKEYTYFIKDTKELTQSETQALTEYKTFIDDIVEKFNALEVGATLNADFFKNIDIVEQDKGLYSGLTMNMLTSTEYDTKLNEKFHSPTNLGDFKTKMYDFIHKNFDIVVTNEINVYNLTALFNKLSETEVIVSKNQNSSKTALALELKEVVRESLGFSPTVRNIIEIYTAASEVFLEALHQVATEAEGNKDRTAQLKEKFADTKTNDLRPGTFYAWPDYKEKDGNGVYIQKYLGAKDVLNRPQDVDELIFIDDLYNAFIKAAQQEQNAENLLNQTTKLWFPVSPLDTKILIQTEPYSRTDFGTYQDVIRLCVIRGMTFLGYTNNTKSLTENEIMAMAKAEVNDMLRGVATDKIKQALSVISKSTDLSEFINSVGPINAEESRVVYLNADKATYFYNYIFDVNTPTGKSKRHIIPVNTNFTGDWPTDKAKLRDLRDKEDYQFLTNYSQVYGDKSGRFDKEDDGGIYIKIIPISEYTQSYNSAELNEMPEGATIESVLILEKIKVDTVESASGAGYNVFGGPLGIQDYSVISCSTDEGGELQVDKPTMPTKYLFYSNDARQQAGGLAFDRLSSIKKATTKYDYKEAFPVIIEKAFYYGSQGHIIHDYLGQNRALLNRPIDGVSYPYFEQPAFFTAKQPAIGPDVRAPHDENSFSLFGSKFYYAQKTDYAKAFLFLNNLPFNKADDGSPFGKNEIQHLFNIRGGFIHAPKLWCAWVGSILWRWESSPMIKNGDDIVAGGSGPNDPITWTEDGINLKPNYTYPARNQYLSFLAWDPNHDGLLKSLPNFYVDDLLVRLPAQVRKEFKDAFFDFVNGSDAFSWTNIKPKLEIWTGSSALFNDFVDDVNKRASLYDNRKQTGALLKQEFNNPRYTPYLKIDSYSVILPILTIKNDIHRNQYLFLELADGSDAVTTLINAMKDEAVILNTNFKIWEDNEKIEGEDNTKENATIFSTTPKFELYFNTIKEAIKASEVGLGEKEQIKAITNDIFGTSDENEVKLMLYKHCKNIHDKWLAGVTSGDKILYQCGPTRSIIDTGLAKHYGNKEPKFIDSFRFVSRSFEDVGDLLYINPMPINDYLTENQNSSIYDSISNLLSANKFEFIALPTFINFRDDEELKAMFKPYGNYGEAIKEGSCGPTFVCVYAGEKSKHLAIYDGEYKNDGFNLRCSKNAQGDSNFPNDVPADFTSGQNNDYEDPVAVFTVKYSQQNQNIFKDISLDQAEFTESEESLKIMDDIAQKGAETNRSLAGQNLYNVYSVRSYTAQIEMMGNAMIQPMMYFQLDNIPMFHGAYMITGVKHAIKPNNMSTNFTGVRIKYSKTKLLDALDIFMPLIDTLDTSNATGTGGGLSMNYVDSYYNDLLANIPKDKNIGGSVIGNKATLTQRGEKEFSNWESGKLEESNPKALPFLTAYAKETPGISATQFATNKEPWSAIFVSYVMVAGDSNFPKAAQHFTYVTAGMHGTNGYEVFPLKAGKGLVITPEVGDIFCRKRSDTNYTASHCDVLYKIEGNVGHLLGGNRSVQGGSPNDGLTVNDGQITFTNGKITDSTEVKSYKLLMKKTNNKYYNKKTLIDTGKGTSELVNIETGTNADYWSLVTICALENGTPQGRSDVAQSIYNRLSSKIYGKHTIKELIVQGLGTQYEPVGRAKNEFLAIKDKQSAINAFKKSKGVNFDVATKNIEASEKAINNTDLIKASQSYIQGRTDFYSSAIANQIPKNAVGLVQRDNQIFGWFVGPTAINYGKKNPPTAVKPDFTGVA